MGKTVYECYRLNGNRTGFWVTRETWDKKSAFFVKRIGQQTSGRLAVAGPYHSSLWVWGDSYEGERVVDRNSRLQHAGTFSWHYLGTERDGNKHGE